MTLTPFLTTLFLLSATATRTAVAQTVCGLDGKGFSIAGSSTVEPVADVWVSEFKKVCPNVGEITVEGGGSSSGAGRVCANEEKGAAVEVGDMSREWKDTEAKPNAEKDYIYECLTGDTTRSAIQIDVAIDGLTVATQASGPGTDCVKKLGGLTMDQLRWIFTSYNDTELMMTGWDANALGNSDGNEMTHLWSELHTDCEATEIKIAGADDQSGTYEYFLETVLTDHANGETFGNNRPDMYFNSDKDRDIVLYLESIAGEGIGYFGYAYFFENREILDAAPIANSAGDMVEPNPSSVGDGTYNPLARRIYMNLYNDEESLKKTAPLVRFGLSSKGSDLVTGTGYVPLPEAEKAEMLSRLPPEEQPSTPSSAWGERIGAILIFNCFVAIFV